MSEDDVVISIQKHATSKISKYEDLEAIRTLGFRGEALSSMAAVSQLEIHTEQREDEIGTLVRIDEYGKLIKEKVSFAKGTCVSLKNLFYNTPARRNFLKTDATELKHIIDTFNKVSLRHPKIYFKFFNDDELIFDYPAGTLENRIESIFADNMLDALIPVEEKTDYMNVHGFIGKPSLLKKSKGEQYLFLNSRYVISKQINHAVFSAYENFLEKGDYPFFILFVEIDPHHIDVNVHPSKLEVRFENEKDIYTFVVAVIKKSLGLHDLVPNMSFSESNIQTEKLKKVAFSKTEKDDFSDRPSFKEKGSSARTNFSDKEIDLLFSSLPDIETYDKSKALKRLDADLPFSQQLLFPKTIELDPGRYQVLKEIDTFLNKLGFDIKYSSKNTIVIVGVTDDIISGSEEKVLLEIIDEYADNQREKELEEKDNIVKSYSCHTAIKAGDKLSEREMRLLIDQLFATSMPYVCPHGRPVVIKISLDEFDRRFGRTS